MSGRTFQLYVYGALLFVFEIGVLNLNQVRTLTFLDFDDEKQKLNKLFLRVISKCYWI